MFSTENHDTVVVVNVSEELDTRNAQQTKEFFAELVAGGSSSVIVDLSAIDFIDSSGLGALVTALKLARQNNGIVRLCALTPPVNSIFQLTRLSRLFDIYETRDEALASFS